MSKTAAPKSSKSKKPAEPSAADLADAKAFEAEMFDKNVSAIKSARALAADFAKADSEDSINAAMGLLDRVEGDMTIARGLLGDAKRIVGGRSGDVDDVFEIAQILIDDEAGADRLTRISKELPVATFTTRFLIDTYDRCLGVDDEGEDEDDAN